MARTSTSRRSLAELERLCQKPDHRRIGNWLARRVTRPLALRITWVVHPWGVSAHAMTLVALAFAIAAAIAFGRGTPSAWLIGAVLLQFWYLLDHVDGQLARYRGVASVDGARLDYLMHHVVNLVVPMGVGWGLFKATRFETWALAGWAWGLGLLLLGLQHDARYKAFMQRLKRTRGELILVGGGGARPMPPPPLPKRPVSWLVWLSRKHLEPHVWMCAMGILAIAQWWNEDVALRLGQIYLAISAPLALGLACLVIGRGLQKGESEREFAAWYRVPEGHAVEWRDGWWVVTPLAAEDHPPTRPTRNDESPATASVTTPR